MSSVFFTYMYGINKFFSPKNNGSQVCTHGSI